MRKYPIRYPFNFGCTPINYPYKRAWVVVIPMAYESTPEVISGTRFAPMSILQASRYMELYNEEFGFETYRTARIHTFDEMELSSVGTIQPTKQVYNLYLKLLKDGKYPVMIGGEHTISIGAVMAFKELYPDLNVVYLDGFANLLDDYQGNKYSRLTVGRRLAELCPVHTFGVKSISRKEQEFLKANDRIKVHFAREERLSEIPAERFDEISNFVYLTIDVSIFDPYFLPAMSNPEPGGASWDDFFHLMKILFARKKVIGFDVVEAVSSFGNPTPNLILAKIIYRLIALAVVSASHSSREKYLS